MSHFRSLFFFCAVLLLPLLACGPIPEWDGAISLGGEPTPEPTSTPQGDTIHFQTLTYRVSLLEGETIPGTTMTYIGRSNDAYEVRIDGLAAFKQAADSLAWKGAIAPGVIGRYNLRLTTTILGELFAAGPVEITVLNPFPIQLPSNYEPSGTLVFNEIVAQYYVPVGHAIPGTTLIYAGQQEQGAELSGTADYPYYSQGDSLRWTGQLLENVVLRYNLRILTISEEGIRVAGTAELWVR
ncbi:MAG: hypothetical protein IPL28_03575 [Chloroflexi bacterium]|nr:hypothetical protein [Chloroflexota bacterium]MDA0246163.1 hypothetical protein [Chloroflexota bacterium]